MRREWNENGATASNVAAISRKGFEPPNDHCDILQDDAWFAVMGLQLWKQKVAASLDAMLQETGRKYKERALYAWSSGENEPPARVLALLLRSSDGPRVLAWIMRTNPPTWWRVVQGAAQTFAHFN